MSDTRTDTQTLALPEERLTVDDLRHKALAVGQTVQIEAKRLIDQPRNRYVLAGAVIFAVAISFAYYLGSRKTDTRDPWGHRVSGF